MLMLWEEDQTFPLIKLWAKEDPTFPMIKLGVGKIKLSLAKVVG